METSSIAHLGDAIAAGSKRAPPALLPFAAFQGIFWSLFWLFLFLVISPYHPFFNMLLAQTAATTGFGLAVSSALVWAHLVLRRKSGLFLIVVVAPISSVLLGVAWYLLAAWVGGLLDPFEVSPVILPSGFLFASAQMPVFPTVLLLWSLLFLAVSHARQQQVQREQMLRSEALAHEARLRMLRYQLNPHFLFNALNSIGSLADEGQDRLRRMVGELSRFLRYSLLDSERLEVPFGDELQAVEDYLKVEKLRFDDDLEVRIEVEPAAAGRIVPAFVVLPLIENAIKHGRRTSPTPLRIHVTGRIRDGALRIEVANSGHWAAASRSPEPAVGTGTGLANVCQRLLAHYPGRHQLNVREDRGWVYVRIRIDNDV